MHMYLIALSILGFAAASPLEVNQIREELLSHDVTTRNSALENLLLGLIEDLRQTMLTGSDDVPILDPLEIDYLHLDERDLPLPGAHVTVRDLTVSKLSTFVVDYLSVNAVSIILQRYRLEFDFYVPVFEIDAANYDLSVAVSGYTVFGNGSAKMNLIQPRVKGALVVAPRFSIGSGIYLTILSSEVSFALTDFDPHINGMQNDETVSNFINSFLRHFVPECVILFENDITEFLSETVMEVGNELLADLNLGSILG